MDKIRNRTERALVAKGIDSETAHRLRTTKHTVSSLLQSNPDILRQFGVNESVISAFYKSDRPAIPPKILNDVLFASRWACCVCRNDERPIIVHHINEWASSRDHSASNLAVLCPLHHGEAHTTRALELSLTGSRVKEFKTRWESSCASNDLILTLKKSDLRLNTWFYFNHMRIYELAKELMLNVRLLPGYATLREFQSCNEEGAILKAIPKDDYMYNHADRIALYDYVSEMFFSVIKKVGVVNISDYLDRGFISHHILEGDVILVQGQHTFTPVSKARAGPDLSEVWRKSNRVRVSCVIDVGEATSGSAWSVWLRSQQKVASIIKVRSITREGGLTQIRGTALAIRDQDDELKRRNYLQRAHDSGFRFRDPGDDVEIEDAEPWELVDSAPEEF